MSLFKTCAALGAASFVAYCFYFDHKRRNHPDFRKNLKERRMREKKEKARSADDLFDIPMFDDPSKMQQYFMQNISLGDELINSGNIEIGALHLAKALVVCTQKQELLSALNRSLPEPVFQLIMKFYQKANDKFITKMLMNQNIADQLKNLVSRGGDGPSSNAASRGIAFEDADIE